MTWNLCDTSKACFGVIFCWLDERVWRKGFGQHRPNSNENIFSRATCATAVQTVLESNLSTTGQACFAVTVYLLDFVQTGAGIGGSRQHPLYGEGAGHPGKTFGSTRRPGEPSCRKSPRRGLPETEDLHFGVILYWLRQRVWTIVTLADLL